MVKLVLDTSFSYLHIYLLDNQNKIIDGISEWCPKNQSEMIMPKLDQLCQHCSIDPSEIKELIVTNGPGSYTGLRIALTLAKVLAIDPSVKISTLCSLDLVFGCNQTGYAIMDARAHRLYVAHYTNNTKDLLQIMDKDVFMQLLDQNTCVMGQASLVNRKDCYADLRQCLSTLVLNAQPVQDCFQLKPMYLKENDAYDPHKSSAN